MATYANQTNLIKTFVTCPLALCSRASTSSYVSNLTDESELTNEILRTENDFILK